MEIRRIFTKRGDGRLWAVACPSFKKKTKQSDVLTELFKQFTDTQYLFDFFTTHSNDLNSPFWGGISVDEAIQKVYEEANAIEKELYSIELKLPGYENSSLSDIFLPLHQWIYAINFTNEKFRKAKPNFSKPMIRIYAIELDDGTLIISGGAIKLKKEMQGEIFDQEIQKLVRLREFLKNEGIIDIDGLKELWYE